MKDTIEIRRLKVPVRIGVPVEERAEVQTVLVTVIMTPVENFRSLGDEIGNTIDYAAAAEGIRQNAGVKERKLIETLAEDTAAYLLGNFPLERVAVSIEKFILPETECVAVHVIRLR